MCLSLRGQHPWDTNTLLGLPLSEIRVPAMVVLRSIRLYYDCSTLYEAVHIYKRDVSKFT